MLSIFLKTALNYTIGKEIPVEVEVANIGDTSSLFHIPTTASGKLVYDFFH